MKKIKKFAKTVDIFFLNPFQKFSHWSQKTLGPTNFGWARFCVILFLAVTALIYGLYCYQAIYKKDTTFSAWSITFCSIYIFTWSCGLVDLWCSRMELQ